MKKYMKPPTLKKVVVKCASLWMDEFEIDPEIFDDIYVEAATRAIEKRKDEPGFRVTVILEVWEKKDFKRPDKHFCYNTYRILINAGMHERAEMLRINFMKNSVSDECPNGIDLQKESLKGENDGDTNDTKTDAPPSTDTKSDASGK